MMLWRFPCAVSWSENGLQRYRILKSMTDLASVSLPDGVHFPSPIYVAWDPE